MAKVYINGEQVTGCTNYASAVSCVDKDGNKSTVQDEMDKLSNSVDEQNKKSIKVLHEELTTNENGSANTSLPVSKKLLNVICDSGDLMTVLTYRYTGKYGVNIRNIGSGSFSNVANKTVTITMYYCDEE